MMKNFSKYILIQVGVMTGILITLIFILVRYQQSKDEYDLISVGHSISNSVQQHITITEGVLTSLAYNYEIDSNIDRNKFNTLAAKYMEKNTDILYIQHKNKETVTDMVYPQTYNYTIGSTLKGRPEVETAVDNAIQDKITTANDPFILKDTDNLLGLVIRYPLYTDNKFDGFFVVVFDLKSYISKVIKEVNPESYIINIYDKKGELIWGNSDEKGKYIYTSKVSIMDNYWTVDLSPKSNGISTNVKLIFSVSVLALIFMGVLIYLQFSILKKDKNIKYLDNLQKELKKLKQSYTLALDSANDALWEWNLITDEIITSDKWVDITGNTLQGHGLNAILQEEIIYKDDYKNILDSFEMCLKGDGKGFHKEYRIKNKNGEYTWVQNIGKVYFDDEGAPSKMAGSVSNIEERKQRESKIEYLAFYDMLTGLPNKVKFISTLEESLKRIKVTTDQYSILMLDIDNFKNYNDLLGLDFCDNLLKLVGKRLSCSISHESMLARFGGDEFLILIRNWSDLEEVKRFCGSILNVFDSPFEVVDKQVYLSVSIGVVYCIGDTSTVNDILRDADIALNKAKESGKNQYCIYDIQMHNEIIRRSNVEACIREALSKDTMMIHYQLQQDLTKNEIRGIEALARLHSKELGMISPFEFISVAEHTGLIIPLGNWMLKNACAQGKRWIDKGYKIGILSVNISVHQLHDESFYYTIKEILSETDFPVSQLELEITESVLLNSSENNIEILKSLKSLGVSIALDDFGTGYSSLSYLTVLPIDTLKIDKSFLVKNLEKETENQVVKSIIELAHVLDLKVVSEGVETAEQKQVLKEMGCNYIQGYYFAKPSDAGSVEKRFKK